MLETLTEGLRDLEKGVIVGVVFSCKRKAMFVKRCELDLV